MQMQVLLLLQQWTTFRLVFLNHKPDHIICLLESPWRLAISHRVKSKILRVTYYTSINIDWRIFLSVIMSWLSSIIIIKLGLGTPSCSLWEPPYLRSDQGVTVPTWWHKLFLTSWPLIRRTTNNYSRIRCWVNCRTWDWGWSTLTCTLETKTDCNRKVRGKVACWPCCPSQGQWSSRLTGFPQPADSWTGKREPSVWGD